MSQLQRSSINTNSVGKRVHDYVFVKELGKGAFGQVFQARNVVTEELVAIKCVPKIKLQEHNGIVDQLLKNEVSVLQQINHPHVVKLVTYMESVNQCYIVMEYCNSGDFEQYWKRRNKKIPEQEAIDFMKQILKGMQALHEKNVLHRDLKLANILIHNETLKIADLGFCKQLNDKNATERLSLGSLGNMAPEVVEQLPYGMQADMFSIGSIFYQLLFGQFPFSTASQRQFLQEISLGRPDFRKNGVNISPQLATLIGKMLEKDPHRRLTWTALYEDPIIIEKLDTRSIQININNMLARDIDVKGNQEFYKQVERSQLQQPVMRQAQLKEIKVVEEDIRPQNQQLIETQLKLAEERTQQEKEVYEVTQKYMKSRNEIVYLTVTLEEINKVQHSEAVHGLLPCLLLTKKMALLSQKLINRILNYDNIFNTRYLDKVYQNKFFEQFQQVLIDENEFFQNSLQYYVNSAKSPNNKLEKHIQPAWRIEIQDDPSINFEQIFDECLRNYFFILQELLQRSKDQQEQSQLMSTAIKIIDCLHYDKTIGKSQIIINRDEIDITRKTFDQKKQILDEKTHLFLQNIQ